jgi:hypothetical protein
VTTLSKVFCHFWLYKLIQSVFPVKMLATSFPRDRLTDGDRQTHGAAVMISRVPRYLRIEDRSGTGLRAVDRTPEVGEVQRAIGVRVGDWPRRSGDGERRARGDELRFVSTAASSLRVSCSSRIGSMSGLRASLLSDPSRMLCRSLISLSVRLLHDKKFCCWRIWRCSWSFRVDICSSSPLICCL